MRRWHVETHRSDRAGWLRAAVLGANDGIVSVAGLVVGLANGQPLRLADVADVHAGVHQGLRSGPGGDVAGQDLHVPGRRVLLQPGDHVEHQAGVPVGDVRDEDVDPRARPALRRPRPEALLPRREQLRPAWASRVRTVLTDSAYQGQFAQQVQALGWQHEVASRPPSVARGFVPVANRWVVERTFAWLNCFRRLVVDYERTPASHVAWVLLANLTMTLQRATSD